MMHYVDRDLSGCILFLQGVAILLLLAAWKVKTRRNRNGFRWNQLALFAAMRGIAKWLENAAEHLRHATLHDVLDRKSVV